MVLSQFGTGDAEIAFCDELVVGARFSIALDGTLLGNYVPFKTLETDRAAGHSVQNVGIHTFFIAGLIPEQKSTNLSSKLLVSKTLAFVSAIETGIH